MKEPTTTSNTDEIVPGRLTSAELRAMALRQQQQIDSQHQLLATKEQRLRFLKTQEVRNAVANAEGERLRRLRERVEAQESKLRRLRALRGQVDLQKTYNVTLSNDLDSIRALFSEKEKELSLAVAKVEALTRQLEDLRRDRRCPLNLLAASGGTQTLPPQATRELEKLRRELMYRNQMSLQQDARLHLQREALQQRQAELRSVDQRIYELQTRLQRKKAANIQIVTQNQNHQQQQQLQLPQHLLPLQQQQQQKQAQLPSYNSENAFQTTLTKQQGVAALKQQLLEKQVNQHGQQHIAKFSNIINRDHHNRNVLRGNVAAVEPYIHTPQKSTITPTANFLNVGNILKHAAATANTNQQNQLIQDLTHVKLNLASHQHLSAPATNPSLFSGESDESKLAKKMLNATISTTEATILKSDESPKQTEMDSAVHIYAEVGPKKRDLVKEVTTNSDARQEQQPTTSSASNNSNTQTSKIPKSIVSSTTGATLISKLNNTTTTTHQTILTTAMTQAREKSDHEVDLNNETISAKNKHQLTVHSMPLGTANKSVATAVGKAALTTTATTTTTTTTTTTSTTTLTTPASLTKESSLLKLKSLTASSLTVPPRKPVSSVAPTSLSSSIPKMITYSPKVNRVAPSVVTASSGMSTFQADRPALPPKPSKMSPTEITPSADASSTANTTTAPTVAPSTSKKSPPLPIDATQTVFGLQIISINDNLPIKAKPLTIRKQPMSEQPRLKSITSSAKPLLQAARKNDVPTATAFLFPEVMGKRNSRESTENMGYSPEQTQAQQEHSPTHVPTSSNTSLDETDRADLHSSEEKSPDSLKRRMRSTSATTTNGKPKLARRVSFDPLALLLDASLEGELELVKKTAMQVANASAANDEGITALHNAICAGHIDIVKFLVEFGCDVNAQDSDGWTPLHCAASCNNLLMVKFLVESGACLFASTLSDHETPAEKCEEDEEGFDGCSEYLYSIQEKLGILHNGEVFAVFCYEAQNNDELTFSVNERLTIMRKGDDAESEWWWAKNTNDDEGYVPRNLLGLYPRVPPQSSNFND